MSGFNLNPLQFCLGNPMDREAWWATVHGFAEESDPTKQLNNNNKYTIYIAVQVGSTCVLI